MMLLERVRDVAARRHLSPRTLQCYLGWVRQFLRFSKVGHQWRHPRELHGQDVAAFLNDLARRRKLSASSQNQALNAVVFLYRHVLDELEPDHLGPIAVERVARPAKVPTVLSAAEAARVIAAVPDGSTHRLMVELLYGCGLRLMECCTLRVRDLDFARAQIIVRQAKGMKDRVVMLPAALGGRLRLQVERVEQRWREDLEVNGGCVPLPPAVAHKCPRAERELAWQFVFPSAVLRRDEQGRGFR
jgi:site-specific recombinase XerD